jgi:hypothetical protein
MAQTSIEWMIEKLMDKGYGIPKEWREQAKQLHKQEIVNAFEEGQKQVINLEGNWYYNETYNNEKS